jgi:hypoxanthine phosphoribosyltransferase
VRSSPPPRGRVLLDAAVIGGRVRELATEVDATYAQIARPLHLVCVLKGSLIFTADLCRALTVPVEIDTIAVRSYHDGAQPSGDVELVKDVGSSLRDRDVLIVEDIIDTGLTTSFLHAHVAQHQPCSLRLVTLLDKPARRLRPVRIDFCGFVIDDHFVVGYGLDHAERWRSLPDLWVMEPP